MVTATSEAILGQLEGYEASTSSTGKLTVISTTSATATATKETSESTSAVTAAPALSGVGKMRVSCVDWVALVGVLYLVLV